jgi:hypothetical protein
MNFKDKCRLRRPLEIRFWEKVLIIPEHACWEWIGGFNGRGYGQMTYNKKPRKAPQVSWYLHTGEWPKLWVLHHCDNRACVRPEHLYLGTRKDNIRDMMLRKRNKIPNKRGEEQGLSKLKEKDILKIRQDKRPSRSIAKAYGVAQSTIISVLHRETWKHI